MKPLLEGQPRWRFRRRTRATLTAPRSRVPTCGKSVNEARAILQRAGRTTSVETTDNNAERGTVVGQNPQGQALPGETVLLSVSSGNAPEAPDAPGEDEARGQLTGCRAAG